MIRFWRSRIRSKSLQVRCANLLDSMSLAWLVCHWWNDTYSVHIFVPSLDKSIRFKVVGSKSRSELGQILSESCGERRHLCHAWTSNYPESFYSCRRDVDHVELLTAANVVNLLGQLRACCLSLRRRASWSRWSVLTAIQMEAYVTWYSRLIPSLSSRSVSMRPSAASK